MKVWHALTVAIFKLCLRLAWTGFVIVMVVKLVRWAWGSP